MSTLQTPGFENAKAARETGDLQPRQTLGIISIYRVSLSMPFTSWKGDAAWAMLYPWPVRGMNPIYLKDDIKACSYFERPFSPYKTYHPSL